MFRHPPIRFDLTPAEEVQAYARLKLGLAELWSRVFPGPDEPYTSVVVPSVTVDEDELSRHAGASFHEETLLFLLIRLRNPRARVVYVTSRPIPPFVMDYYLHFLAGIPASHAASRLTLVSAHDGSARPLTRKILERPRLLERIRAAIPDLSRAYMTVFRATPLERRLAVLLGIPLNAADPELEGLCARSAARGVLREAGVEVPHGFESLRDEVDLVGALESLARERPGLDRAIVKLEMWHWGDGHAVVRLPRPFTPEGARRALRALQVAPDAGTAEDYLERLRRSGGVVEEFVEGVERVVSGQVRINPLGEVFLTATHDELRAGAAGTLSEGCVFPAAESHRGAVRDAALAVGRTLAGRGLVSRLSVEFLATRDGAGRPRLLGSEINLGVGGSTHPLLAVRFLTGGELDPATGLFHSPAGRALFYRATDRLQSDRYRRLVPEDVIEALTMHRLNYSPHGEAGALVHTLGAVSELGRVGLVAVGHSGEDADALFHRTVATLDAASETPAGA